MYQFSFHLHKFYNGKIHPLMMAGKFNTRGERNMFSQKFALKSLGTLFNHNWAGTN